VIILFSQVALNRRVLNKILHHSIIWEKPSCGYMFAVSWALTKGDWWKGKNESLAKFISYNWFKKSDGYIRTGIYIGRLAIVWQTHPKTAVTML